MSGERDEWEGGRQRNEWGKWRGSVAGPGGRREKQRKLASWTEKQGLRSEFCI